MPDAEDVFSAEELAKLDVDFLEAEECPRCGHPDDRHLETGCELCGCPGP